jgi:anionic cell wall polymer biosynthesis LytR-Cps2A-Psr (LCP) family protein
MLRLPGGRALAAKAVYGLSCVVASLVLAVAAVGYYAQKQVDSIGTSSVAAGGPSTGAMNILIMGLESRTYFNGTPLDHHLTHFLDIGSVGGEQTNTLILLHIFAGGQKAVAFSIPRDDYVQLYGTLGYAGTPPMNKIDDAYNAGMQQEMINDQTSHPRWSSAQVNFDGNEAGGGGHGRGTDRGQDRQDRRAQPDRLLRAGQRVRRHRGVRQAVARRPWLRAK